MTEKEKYDQLVYIAEYLEAINNAIAETRAIQALSFYDLTPDIWEVIQKNAEQIREILKPMASQLTNAPKLIDNDALTSHLLAVVSAPDE